MGLDKATKNDAQAIKDELNSTDSQQVKSQRIHEELKTYLEDYKKENPNDTSGASGGAWTSFLNDIHENSKEKTEAYLPKLLVLDAMTNSSGTDPVSQLLAQEFLKYFHDDQVSSAALEAWSKSHDYEKTLASGAIIYLDDSLQMTGIDLPYGAPVGFSYTEGKLTGFTDPAGKEHVLVNSDPTNPVWCTYDQNHQLVGDAIPASLVKITGPDASTGAFSWHVIDPKNQNSYSLDIEQKTLTGSEYTYSLVTENGISTLTMNLPDHSTLVEQGGQYFQIKDEVVTQLLGASFGGDGYALLTKDGIKEQHSKSGQLTEMSTNSLEIKYDQSGRMDEVDDLKAGRKWIWNAQEVTKQGGVPGAWDEYELKPTGQSNVNLDLPNGLTWQLVTDSKTGDRIPPATLLGDQSDPFQTGNGGLTFQFPDGGYKVYGVGGGSVNVTSDMIAEAKKLDADIQSGKASDILADLYDPRFTSMSASDKEALLYQYQLSHSGQSLSADLEKHFPQDYAQLSVPLNVTETYDRSGKLTGVHTKSLDADFVNGVITDHNTGVQWQYNPQEGTWDQYKQGINSTTGKTEYIIANPPVVADLLGYPGDPFYDTKDSANGEFKFNLKAKDAPNTVTGYLVYEAGGSSVTVTPDIQKQTTDLNSKLQQGDAQGIIDTLKSSTKAQQDAIEWLYQKTYGHSLHDDMSFYNLDVKKVGEVSVVTKDGITSFSMNLPDHSMLVQENGKVFHLIQVNGQAVKTELQGVSFDATTGISMPPPNALNSDGSYTLQTKDGAVEAFDRTGKLIFLHTNSLDADFAIRGEIIDHVTGMKWTVDPSTGIWSEWDKDGKQLQAKAKISGYPDGNPLNDANRGLKFNLVTDLGTLTGAYIVYKAGGGSVSVSSDMVQESNKLDDLIKNKNAKDILDQFKNNIATKTPADKEALEWTYEQAHPGHTLSGDLQSSLSTQDFAQVSIAINVTETHDASGNVIEVHTPSLDAKLNSTSPEVADLSKPGDKWMLKSDGFWYESDKNGPVLDPTTGQPVKASLVGYDTSSKVNQGPLFNADNGGLMFMFVSDSGQPTGYKVYEAGGGSVTVTADVWQAANKLDGLITNHNAQGIFDDLKSAKTKADKDALEWVYERAHPGHTLSGDLKASLSPQEYAQVSIPLNVTETFDASGQLLTGASTDSVLVKYAVDPKTGAPILDPITHQPQVVEVDDLKNHGVWLWGGGHWNEYMFDGNGKPLLDANAKQIVGPPADLLSPTGDPFYGKAGLTFNYLDGSYAAYLADGREITVSQASVATTGTLNDLVTNKKDGKSVIDILHSMNREDKDAVEWLYQQKYPGHTLQGDMQQYLNASDYANALIPLNEGDTSANTYDHMQMMLGKLNMPDSISSSWYPELGQAGPLSTTEQATIDQLITGIWTSDIATGTPICVQQPISDAQKAAETQLRDTFSAMSKEQIDDLRKQYVAKGMDLDKLIMDDPNISPWTKAALQIDLKGSDQRTPADTYALINIGLHTHDIGIFEEAFAGVSKDQLQQMLLQHPDLAQSVASTFSGDNLKSAQDCLNLGIVSVATQISRDGNDDKKLLADVNGMSDHEKKLFKDGWSMIQDYADMMQKNPQWTRPDDKTLRDQAITYYENNDGQNDGSGKASLGQKAALDYFKQVDDAFYGAGVNDWKRLSFEGGIVFSDAPLIQDFHDLGDVSKIEHRIQNMSEAEWNLYTGYGANSDRFRQYLNAELDSLKLSTDEKQQIQGILDFKRHAKSFADSQQIQDIIQALTLDQNNRFYHSDHPSMMDDILHMSVKDMLRYQDARKKSDYDTNPNNFARQIDDKVDPDLHRISAYGDLPPTSTPEKELMKQYLRDVLAATPDDIKNHKMASDPIVNMLNSYLHGASLMEIVSQMKSLPGGAAALKDWLGVDDSPPPSNDHRDAQNVFDAMVHKFIDSDSKFTALPLNDQIRHPNSFLDNDVLAVFDLIASDKPITADVLLPSLSGGYDNNSVKDKFEALKLVSEDDRLRLIKEPPDQAFRDKVFDGLDDDTRKLFLNTLKDEIRTDKGVTFAAVDIVEAYSMGLKTLNDVKAVLDTSKMTDKQRADFLTSAETDFALKYPGVAGGNLEAALLAKCTTDQERLDVRSLLDTKPRNDLRDYLNLVDYTSDHYGGVEIAARADQLRKAEAEFKALIIKENNGGAVDEAELKKAGKEWMDAVQAYAEAKGATAEQIQSLVIMAAGMVSVILTGGADLPVVVGLFAGGAALDLLIHKAMEGTDFSTDPKSILSKILGGGFEGAFAALNPAEIIGLFGVGDAVAEAATTAVTKEIADAIGANAAGAVAEATTEAIQGALGDTFREAFTSSGQITADTIKNALTKEAKDVTDPLVKQALESLAKNPDALAKMAAAIAEDAPWIAKKGLSRAIDFIARHAVTGAFVGSGMSSFSVGVQGVVNWDSTQPFGDQLGRLVQQMGTAAESGALNGALMSVVIGGTVAGAQKIIVSLNSGPKGTTATFVGNPDRPTDLLEVMVGGVPTDIAPGDSIPPGATGEPVLRPADAVAPQAIPTDITVLNDASSIGPRDVPLRDSHIANFSDATANAKDGLKFDGLDGTGKGAIKVHVQDGKPEWELVLPGGKMPENADLILRLDADDLPAYRKSVTDKFAKVGGNDGLDILAPTSIADATNTTATMNDASSVQKALKPEIAAKLQESGVQTGVVDGATIKTLGYSDMEVPGQLGKKFGDPDVLAFYDPKTNTVYLKADAIAEAKVQMAATGLNPDQIQARIQKMINEEYFHALDHAMGNASNSPVISDAYNLDTQNHAKLLDPNNPDHYITLDNAIGGRTEAHYRMTDALTHLTLADGSINPDLIHLMQDFPATMRAEAELLLKQVPPLVSAHDVAILKAIGADAPALQKLVEAGTLTQADVAAIKAIGANDAILSKRIFSDLGDKYLFNGDMTGPDFPVLASDSRAQRNIVALDQVTPNQEVSVRLRPPGGDSDGIDDERIMVSKIKLVNGKYEGTVTWSNSSTYPFASTFDFPDDAKLIDNSRPGVPGYRPGDADYALTAAVHIDAPTSPTLLKTGDNTTSGALPAASDSGQWSDAPYKDIAGAIYEGDGVDHGLWVAKPENNIAQNAEAFADYLQQNYKVLGNPQIREEFVSQLASLQEKWSANEANLRASYDAIEKQWQPQLTQQTQAFGKVLTDVGLSSDTPATKALTKLQTELAQLQTEQNVQISEYGSIDEPLTRKLATVTQQIKTVEDFINVRDGFAQATKSLNDTLDTYKNDLQTLMDNFLQDKLPGVNLKLTNSQGLYGSYGEGALTLRGRFLLDLSPIEFINTVTHELTHNEQQYMMLRYVMDQVAAEHSDMDWSGKTKLTAEQLDLVKKGYITATGYAINAPDDYFQQTSSLRAGKSFDSTELEYVEKLVQSEKTRQGIADNVVYAVNTFRKMNSMLDRLNGPNYEAALKALLEPSNFDNLVGANKYGDDFMTLYRAYLNIRSDIEDGNYTAARDALIGVLKERQNEINTWRQEVYYQYISTEAEQTAWASGFFAASQAKQFGMPDIPWDTEPFDPNQIFEPDPVDIGNEYPGLRKIPTNDVPTNGETLSSFSSDEVASVKQFFDLVKNADFIKDQWQSFVGNSHLSSTQLETPVRDFIKAVSTKMDWPNLQIQFVDNLGANAGENNGIIQIDSSFLSNPAAMFKTLIHELGHVEQEVKAIYRIADIAHTNDPVTLTQEIETRMGIKLDEKYIENVLAQRPATPISTDDAAIIDKYISTTKNHVPLIQAQEMYDQYDPQLEKLIGITDNAKLVNNMVGLSNSGFELLNMLGGWADPEIGGNLFFKSWDIRDALAKNEITVDQAANEFRQILVEGRNLTLQAYWSNLDDYTDKFEEKQVRILALLFQ